MLKIHFEKSQRCLSLPLKSDEVVPLHPELLLGFYKEKKIKRCCWHTTRAEFLMHVSAFKYLN